MARETIDDILNSKKAAAPPAGPTAAVPPEDKFFSILVGEGVQEPMLELRFRDGLRTCLPYNDVIWLVYDPEGGVSIDIGGYLVHIKGRGLDTRLFDGLKQRRVSWVREADHELQDHKDNDTFISAITITPPQGFADGDEASSDQRTTPEE